MHRNNILFDENTKYLIVSAELFGSDELILGDPNSESVHVWLYIGYNGKSDGDDEIIVDPETEEDSEEGFYAISRLMKVAGDGTATTYDDVASARFITASEFSTTGLTEAANVLTDKQKYELMNMVVSSYDAIISW